MIIDCEGHHGPILTVISFPSKLPGVGNLLIWATMPDQATCHIRARALYDQGVNAPEVQAGSPQSRDGRVGPPIRSVRSSPGQVSSSRAPEDGSRYNWVVLRFT